MIKKDMASEERLPANDNVRKVKLSCTHPEIITTNSINELSTKGYFTV